MKKNEVDTIIQENKVIYKRYFDAPVDLVFDVWSSHEHLSKWWGPNGFTLTTIQMDFSNGGIWDFIMHGPDGTDYKNKIQFIEINKPHHIYYKHIGDGGDTEDVHFQTRIIFESSGEGTNLTMEQEFPSKEELDRINKQYGAIEGGKQHTENLGNYINSIIIKSIY